MRYFIELLALVLTVAPLGFANKYSTRFPLNESPVSEGGHWLNGATDGLDWSNMLTTGGHTLGYILSPGGYNDSAAILKGTWGPTQIAIARVYVGGSPHQELELRLRSSISSHLSTGYEVTWTVNGGGGKGSYLAVTRWNGALNDWTGLGIYYGSQYDVIDGDIIVATAVGTKIIAYICSVLRNYTCVPQLQITDSTFVGGAPGMGMDWDRLDQNTPSGFSYYSAIDDGPATASTCGPSDVQAMVKAITTANQSTTTADIPPGSCTWTTQMPVLTVGSLESQGNRINPTKGLILWVLVILLSALFGSYLVAYLNVRKQKSQNPHS